MQVLTSVRRDSLVRNSLFIMATTVVNSILGFAYWVVAARWYPTAAVGSAAALVSAMTLVSVVANPGLHSGLTQALPRAESSRSWSTLFTGSLLVGTVTGSAAGVVSGLLMPVLLSKSWPHAGPWTLIFFVLGVVSAALSLVVDYTFVAERVSQHMLFRNAAFGVLKIVLLVGAPAVGMTSTGIVIFGTWVLSAIATVAWAATIGVRRIRRDYSPAVRGARAQYRAMRTALWHHHLANLGCLLPMYVLPLEVVAQVSVQENAYFYVTWMMCGVFMMVSPAVSSSLFAEGSHTPGDVRHAALRSLRTIAILLVPAALALGLGGQLALGAFGPAYATEGFGLLLVVIASSVPDAITNVAISVLRVEHRLREAAALNGMMAVISIALAWVLLPSMGIIGAGVAWLVAQSAGTVVVVLGLATTERRERVDIDVDVDVDVDVDLTGAEATVGGVA
jgi:O-antigen/teichoic acid export membrane protein